MKTARVIGTVHTHTHTYTYILKKVLKVNFTFICDT